MQTNGIKINLGLLDGSMFLLSLPMLRSNLLIRAGESKFVTMHHF